MSGGRGVFKYVLLQLGGEGGVQRVHAQRSTHVACQPVYSKSGMRLRKRFWEGEDQGIQIRRTRERSAAQHSTAQRSTEFIGL